MATDTTDRRLVTVLLVVVAALILLPLLGSVFGAMGVGHMGGTWGGGMWSDGASAPGWVFLLGIAMQLLFLGALVVAGYLVYRALTRSSGDEDQALDELRVAYARGDLTDEEYERRRETLEAEP